MEDLEVIVQRMLDAGENEANIAKVVQYYTSQPDYKPTQEVEEVEVEEQVNVNPFAQNDGGIGGSLQDQIANVKNQIGGLDEEKQELQQMLQNPIDAGLGPIKTSSTDKDGKPLPPVTPRIQEIKDEILQLETDLTDWFPRGGVMGAPGSDAEKELDEYYANQGPTRDADNYNKRKKLDQLKLQAVPTKEELIAMNKQAEETGYTTPLPSEILDPSNKYTNQDLMSLAQQHTNYGGPVSEQTLLMGNDPVFRMYQNLQFQNRLNGGEGEEEKIKAQQRQMSLESRGINESFRVNAPVIADMVTNADDPTGELREKIFMMDEYGINPWTTNPQQNPALITQIGDATPEVSRNFYKKGGEVTSSDIIIGAPGGIQLMNGPVPLGSDPNRSAGQWLWQQIADGSARSTLGSMFNPLADKRYHYKLPDGSRVPYSYFHNPEIQNYYNKVKSNKRKQDDLIEFKGDRQKQTQNAVTEVESFLTDNELLYRDQEAELQKLKNESKNWKKDDPRFTELTQLENTINTKREELQLGERLFDENGNLLNSISSVENQEINYQAEEIAKDQGRDQIEKSLEQAYYDYIELLNQVGNNTVDIGKSRSFVEKAGGWLRYDKYNLFQHSGLNPNRDTWYDDAKNIQKMISSGKLGKTIDLPGNHPLATQFEAAQDRMLVLNRALQLNSDQSTMAEINEVRRNVGNLLEAFSIDDPFQSFYGTGLSVGTSDEEERYKIMKDIKEELGYTLPKEILDAHDETWYELTGDVVTGLAPIIGTVTGMNKFMPMAKGKANPINKIGDALKGSGKSRIWNGLVNTFIGSTKYNHSALNEVAMFSMVDKIGAEAFNSHEADQLFISSLGAGNSLWNQASTKLAGRYGKYFAPVLNKLGYFSSGKRALAVAGQTGVSTTIFEGAKGVEYIAHNFNVNEENFGVGGIGEQFTSKQLVADYLGFLAFNVPGQMKPGIQDAGRDILRLSGHTPEALKAQKVLGVTKGKDGYYGTPKDIQNTVNEKINEIVEKPLTEKELAEEISNMDQNKDLVYDGKPITQKQRNEIQKVQEAGEALMFHNDVVKAQKTAKYMKGLDAQAFTVGQKVLRGEKLTAADKALLNKLGPEYIAYKASGNKQPSEQMRSVVESIYAGDQRAYTGLVAAGINPMSEEGIELVETITDINNLEGQKKKIEKAIKEDPALEPVIQKEIDKIELEQASKKEYMDLIQSEVKDVSDKTYEQDVVDTKDLIDQINEQGGFFGDKIELKEVSETEWRKLKLDPEAEGQFRDNTLYVNKDVALRKQANSVASHELLHALLKNSFKNPNGTITEGGMKIIDSFREMLPPEQQKLINDRISEQYAKDQTVPKDRYYEEYLNAFVDGIKRGTIQYSDRTFNKLADQLGSRFRKQTGVGSGKELYKFLRDFNKANTDVRAKKRIIDFATKDNVPGKPAAKATKTEAPKTKTTSKKKSKTEAKKKTAEVEERLDVEEVVEEKAPESTTVKEKRKYKSPSELIKDLKVVDKKALEEIKDAEESAIGSQNENQR